LSEGFDTFCEIVPEVSHRAQLLHDMACGGLEHAFYIVASTTRILRVVHVRCDSDILDTYLDALDEVWEEADMMWTVHGPIPDLAGINLGYAVDMHTVRTTVHLWRAINKLVDERGYALPAAEMIIPSVVAFWNRCKGPVDVFSRYLVQCEATHMKLSPEGTICLRVLKTLVFNAYHSFILCKMMRHLRGIKTYTSLQQKKNRIVGSIEKFSFNLAEELLTRSTVVPMPNVARRRCSHENERAPDAMQHGSQYHVVEKIFRHPLQNSIRKGTPNLHVAKSILPDIEGKRQQPRCGWCCSHDHEEGVACKRLGYKASKQCSICNVTLCKGPRYFGKSCFELYHTSDAPFDPCTPAADSVRTSQLPRNPNLPSGQKRSASAAADSALEPTTSRPRVSVSSLDVEGSKTDTESTSHEDENDKEN
jgi:hypothetical protein